MGNRYGASLAAPYVGPQKEEKQPEMVVSEENNQKSMSENLPKQVDSDVEEQVKPVVEVKNTPRKRSRRGRKTNEQN